MGLVGDVFVEHCKNITYQTLPARFGLMRLGHLMDIARLFRVVALGHGEVVGE